MIKTYLALGVLLAVGACTTVTTSNPPRTATEQLLISGAAEKAASKIALQVPPESKVFVDSSNFEGTDSKNAVAAIRTSLLKQGMHLVDDKKTADVIIEPRAGALSTDQHDFLIGIPQFSLPIPLASGALTIPEIALYSSNDQKGVAKFAATGYSAKDGSLVATQEPRYGFTHNIKKTLLIFISWSNNDAYPEGVEDEDDKPGDKPGDKTDMSSQQHVPTSHWY